MKDAISKDRYRGAMLGLACGDALGTTVEFQTRGTFRPMTDMVGGGPFNLKPGQWTDDTSMALCLAESLLAEKSMNLKDQLERYVFWWLHGENSVTGRCFDIGHTVRKSLENYANTGEPYSGSVDPQSAGNGSMMRLAPVVLFASLEPTSDFCAIVAESSKTTHGAAEAILCCQVLGCFIRNALSASCRRGVWENEEIHSLAADAQCSSSILNILKGNYQTKEALDIRGSGYAVESLEAAIWAFYHSESFEEGALKAVNLGDDADTTGAIYGQIAGAFYGAKGIPKKWLSKIAWREKISRLADRLHHLSKSSESLQ